MADWPAKKNAIFDLQFPIYDADGDLVTAAAALDTEVSQDGGTFADATNEATEIATGSGCYKVQLTATEMNVDRVMTITKTSTGDAKTAVNMMYTATRQLVDLAHPTVSGRSLDVAATGEAGIDFNNILGTLSAGEIAVGAFAAAAITAAAIATDAIDADALKADAVTEIRSLVTGTSDAGGSATTMIDAARTELIDVHNGLLILFTSGAIANQCRLITDFDAATDTITFAPAVTASVGAGFTYEILPAGGVDVQSWLGVLTAMDAPSALIAGRVDSSVGAMAANVLNAAAIAANAITAAKFGAGAIDAAAIATAAIDADAIAANAFTAGKFATDALTAAKIDAGFSNEIADAILKRDLDQVEATMALHSLGTAALKGTSRVVDDAGVLKTYRTDGTTLHASQTITVNVGADPIDELTAMV